MEKQYERIRVLGSGAYGKVWLVRDKSTGLEWVNKEIKVMNKRELEEALAEAKILSRLNHRNIVQ